MGEKKRCVCCQSRAWAHLMLTVAEGFLNMIAGLQVIAGMLVILGR